MYVWIYVYVGPPGRAKWARACSGPKSITESPLRALFHHGRGALPKAGNRWGFEWGFEWAPGRARWAGACSDPKRAFCMRRLITDAQAFGHPACNPLIYIYIYIYAYIHICIYIYIYMYIIHNLSALRCVHAREKVATQRVC